MKRVTMNGLTMIEVLVTLVVLAIGFLGMAALQITGIRSVNGSIYRTQATLLADDIVERMRANPLAVDANAFMAVDSAAINCAVLPDPYCGEYHDGTDVVAAQSCTSAQMATYDINVWFCGEASGATRRGGVRGLLPQASATITCVDTDPPSGADADACTNRSVHNIVISWSEQNPNRSNGADATVTQNISLTMQP